MTLTRATAPLMHFDDINGHPLKGGKLCTFVAHTSTPIATYKSKDGILNPVEIPLNARGECDIWLDPSQSYKFVLKRADGSMVWTKDDVMADAVYELPSRIVDTVEGDGDVSVTAVMDGDSIKYIVRLNKDFATKEELEEGLSKIRPEFVFNEYVDAEKFAEAFTNNYVLVYEKSVTNPASRSNTTRRFLLSKREQGLGASWVSLTFECTEGETLHKVVITYDIVGETLSFGDIESYGIKDKDDELASTIASYQEETNASLRAMGTTLSQGLNQLQTTKLSAVAHDATIEGDGTADNPLKVVGGGQGGGIEEAPIDGKQYARKDGEWAEVEAGASNWEDIEGKPSTFPPSAHGHSVRDITDFPSIPTKTSELENDSGFIDSATFTAIFNTTPFADIKEAVDNGYCVKCDVSGYTYELVQALSDKITFALTNNVNGSIAQETIWVTSDNEWDGEAVNLAKASDVPTKTSDLTNDSGFSKFVVSETPPAEGTPNDVVTAILGNAGGAGDYGAWEEIASGNIVAGNTYTTTKDIRDFDFILVQSFGDNNGATGETYPRIHSSIVATNSLKMTSSFQDIIRLMTMYSGAVKQFAFRLISSNSLYISLNEATPFFKTFKLYGISLRGRKDEYVLRKVDDQIWNRGSNVLDTNLPISSSHKIIIKAYAHFSAGNACTLLASTSSNWTSTSSHYLSLCTWDSRFWFNGNTSQGELVFGKGTAENELVTIVLNDDNGNVTFNGTDLGSGKNLQEVGYYRINRRNDSPYNGNFESIQIIDKATNEEVMFVHSYKVQGPDGSTFKTVILDDHDHFTPIVT